MTTDPARYYGALSHNLRQYRQFAHRLHPKFGHRVDQLLSAHSRFGDDTTDSIDASYNSLVAGVNQAASDAQLSAADYYTAINNVQIMSRASAQGTYLPAFGVPLTAGNQVTVAGASSQILGVPTWLLLAVVLFIILKKHK